jgi:Tannase-like family of unknown function (DUF6351)
MNRVVEGLRTCGSLRAVWTQVAGLSLDAMNAWLDNLAADPRPSSLQKVAEDKPAGAADACWSPTGVRINEIMTANNAVGQCDQFYPRYRSLRDAAGEPLTQDILKCQLEPLRRGDYPGITFTDAQWGRCRSITFPNGVCDWNKPGVGQAPAPGVDHLRTRPGLRAFAPAADRGAGQRRR